MVNKNMNDLLDEENLNLTQKTLNREEIEKLKLEQNLFGAILAGLLVGFGIAVIWATTATLLKFYSAVDIIFCIILGGFIGVTVKRVGKGIQRLFGYIGAIITFLSIVFAYFLALIAWYSDVKDYNSFFTALVSVDYSLLPKIYITSYFRLHDVVVIIVAVYTGYYYSFYRNINKIIKSK